MKTLIPTGKTGGSACGPDREPRLFAKAKHRSWDRMDARAQSVATGAASQADPATVQDQTMTEINPLRARDQSRSGHARSAPASCSSSIPFDS